MKQVQVVKPDARTLRDGVVDVTAGLISRFGFDGATVQAIADATGYSKTGILHKFGTKEALVNEMVSVCEDNLAIIEAARDRGVGFAGGGSRQLLSALIDLALSKPGTIGLLLASASQPQLWPRREGIADRIYSWFDAGADNPDEDNRIRVTARLGGLALVALTQPAAHTPSGRQIALEIALPALDPHAS